VPEILVSVASIGVLNSTGRGIVADLWQTRVLGGGGGGGGGGAALSCCCRGGENSQKEEANS